MPCQFEMVAQIIASSSVAKGVGRYGLGCAEGVPGRAVGIWYPHPATLTIGDYIFSS